MSIIKDQRGQLNTMMTLFMGIMGFAILMIVGLPMLNALVGSLIGANMSNLSLSSTIIMISGMLGVIFFGFGLMAVLQDVFGPKTPGIGY